MTGLAAIDRWAAYLAYMHDIGAARDIAAVDFAWRRDAGELAHLGIHPRRRTAAA